MGVSREEVLIECDREARRVSGMVPPVPGVPSISPPPADSCGGDDARRAALCADFRDEYAVLAPEVQRRLEVRAVALLAHRQWQTPGSVAVRAAETVFRPSDWATYQLVRWRQGDQCPDAWRALGAAMIEIDAEGEREEAPPGKGPQVGTGWWKRFGQIAMGALGAVRSWGGAAPNREEETNSGDVKTFPSRLWLDMSREQTGALFLQWLWCACRHHWRPQALRKRLPVLRAVRKPRCAYGQNLAPPELFQAQERNAGAALAWYKVYVDIIRRLAGEASIQICVGREHVRKQQISLFQWRA